MALRLKNGVSGPVPALSQAEQDALVNEHREIRRIAHRDEAFRRIASLYGKSDPQSVAFAELNDMARAAELLRREQKGTATAAEVAELDALEAKKGQIDASRAAENTASAQLDAAGIDTTMTVDQRIAEIDTVTPVWP